MDRRLLKKLAERSGVIPHPGDSTFLSQPTNRRKMIEAAVIHHHRFAFYYWLRWTTGEWRKSLQSDDSAPDLVTIDFHDDVGGQDDCIHDELKLLVPKLEVLNVNDDEDRKDAVRRRDLAERNISAYSYLGLHVHNDGQIYPAQYLNAIGDAFVLFKQRGPSERTMRDKHGNEHRIRFFNDPEKLIAALRKRSDRKTYFDLDVDYFFDGRGTMIPPRKIRQLMNPKAELMRSILRRNLEGVTFALEPTYCGGLPGCFKAMSIVMDSLISGNLLGRANIKWRC